MIMTQLAAGSADLSPNSGTVLLLPIGRTPPRFATGNMCRTIN
ncbi:hypothetical protein MAB47J26_09732 [Mycobacteroides abscessus 47J26]|nr:hypothetical protein MAB47J26_09732 [Mycobacteroides abscessus 47J26]